MVIYREAMTSIYSVEPALLNAVADSPSKKDLTGVDRINCLCESVWVCGYLISFRSLDSVVNYI